MAKKTPTPILILYLDCSKLDYSEYNRYISESINVLKEYENYGWVSLLVPITSGQDSRIEVATVNNVPTEFNEFQEEILERIKETLQKNVDTTAEYLEGREI